MAGLPYASVSAAETVDVDVPSAEMAFTSPAPKSGASS